MKREEAITQVLKNGVSRGDVVGVVGLVTGAEKTLFLGICHQANDTHNVTTAHTVF